MHSKRQGRSVFWSYSSRNFGICCHEYCNGYHTIWPILEEKYSLYTWGLKVNLNKFGLCTSTDTLTWRHTGDANVKYTDNVVTVSFWYSKGIAKKLWSHFNSSSKQRAMSIIGNRKQGHDCRWQVPVTLSEAKITVIASPLLAQCGKWCIKGLVVWSGLK